MSSSSPLFGRVSLTLAAVLLVCAPTISAAPQTKPIIAENFSKAEVGGAEATAVTVGVLTFASGKKALRLIEIDGGKKVLQIRGPAYVRVAFPLTRPANGELLATQFRLRFPGGAQDKGGALRWGLYRLTGDLAAASVAEDQGIWAITNPGTKGEDGTTTLNRDNNCAGGDGKIPGFLGGGSGTSAAGTPVPAIDVGAEWAVASLTLRAGSPDSPAEWHANAVVSQGSARSTKSHKFGKSKDFTPDGFNAAGLSVGPGETAQIDTVVVMLVSQ